MGDRTLVVTYLFEFDATDPCFYDESVICTILYGIGVAMFGKVSSRHPNLKHRTGWSHTTSILQEEKLRLLKTAQLRRARLRARIMGMGIGYGRRKFRSQTSDSMDRWKSRGGKSQ